MCTLLQSLHSLFVFINSAMARRPPFLILCLPLRLSVMMHTNFLFVVVLLSESGHTYISKGFRKCWGGVDITVEDGLSLAFLCCYLGANGWRIQKIWEGEVVCITLLWVHGLRMDGWDGRLYPVLLSARIRGQSTLVI